MKITVLALVTLILLSACVQTAPLIPASVTVESPAATISVETNTPRPSLTHWPSRTPCPTPTEWVKIYPTKKALLIHGDSSRNEYTLNFIEWGDFYVEPYLILYEDGQLMFGTGSSVKQLSPAETDEILIKLEQLGFFQIQANSAADLLKGTQNPIYIYPTEGLPAPISVWPEIELTVQGSKSNAISYRREWENYLIQPMKEIISYLNSLSSAGAAPYQPDRLLVVPREIEDIPEGETVIPWPEAVTSPLQRSYLGLYLEGKEASAFYRAAGENLFGYFRFEGKNYEVYLRPILPHECHTYHLSQGNLPPPAEPSFTCDDW
jgi:hypothetical protein